MELLTVMVIIGLLAAIAYPMYAEQLRKSKRAAARVAILQTSVLLERYYTLNNRYTTALGAAVGHYDITVTNLTPQTFLITAHPRFQDGQCSDYTYDHLGTKTVTGTAGNAYCW